MPAFAPLIKGALIPYDGGDGIETPTPERLVALAEYVKGFGALGGGHGRKKGTVE